MAASAQSRPTLRFGDFEVDLHSCELRKQGVRLRLQDQPFQVLRVLLEKRGDLVTREELKQRLWPADTFVDFDDGLNTAIKKIRDALGDSAERPRYIETVPRRGYRFVAAVDAAQGGAANGNANAAVPAAQPSVKLAPSVRWSWVAAAAALSLVAVILVWRLRSVPQAPQVSAEVRSIAVLPLENLSGDPSQNYFAAGLTDALTTELARTVGSSLRVTSRLSAEEYGGKPLAQISRELGVDAVMEGSVIRSGDRVRITAQLIHARSDKLLWAASYDRDLHDVLSLQREIAATIARHVQITLTPRTQARIATAATVNPEAYDLYQRARYIAFSNSRQDMNAAIALLEQAVHIDSNLAPAYALLARAYRNQEFFYEPGNRDLEVRSIQALNRALALDPDLAEAYLVRGSIYWTHENGFRHEQAIRDQEHALELDPNLAEAHHELAKVFHHIGLLERAEQELHLALQVEPTNVGMQYRIAIVWLEEGRLQEAIAGLEGTRRFSPELWSYQMAYALFEVGRKREAETLIRDYLRDDSRDLGGVGNAMQALLYAEQGKTAAARQSIQAAIQKGKKFGHFHHAAYTIGAAYALMDQPTDALRWLRAAADDGFPCYPLYQRDHSLDKIRRDVRFQQFMTDLKNRWEHYKAIS